MTAYDAVGRTIMVTDFFFVLAMEAAVVSWLSTFDHIDSLLQAGPGTGTTIRSNHCCTTNSSLQSKRPGMGQPGIGRRRWLRMALATGGGRVKAHHRFVLTELLCQIDSFEETIARFDHEIEEYCRPFEEAGILLDTIPGVARATSEIIVSEIGTDMNRFPTADHLSAWAGLAPGNNESAGKRRSGKTRKGNKPLVAALTQAAQAAAHTKNAYLSAQFHRIAGRRGKKRAIVAVAHSILVMAYHMIQRKQPYQELDSNYFDKRDMQKVTNRLVGRLEKLGYEVSLQQSSSLAAA